ncbi:MAG: recombination mediator RecR, partial [Bacteroidota bacterium]
MVYTSEAIERVVEQFSSLPSIGRKTAQRLTFYLLKQPKEHVQKFADSLVSLKENVSFCSVCFNYTEQDPCPLCKSEKRNRTLILVVEEPNDIVAIEKTNEYFGLYHVLHGVLNPLDGIGPEELKIKELMARVQGIEEIILALDPSV